MKELEKAESAHEQTVMEVWLWGQEKGMGRAERGGGSIWDCPAEYGSVSMALREPTATHELLQEAHDAREWVAFILHLCPGAGPEPPVGGTASFANMAVDFSAAARPMVSLSSSKLKVYEVCSSGCHKHHIKAVYHSSWQNLLWSQAACFWILALLLLAVWPWVSELPLLWLTFFNSKILIIMVLTS